jgi:hypothetical protein
MGLDETGAHDDSKTTATTGPLSMFPRIPNQ